MMSHLVIRAGRTRACINPHHFLSSVASALAPKGTSTRRPMDEMEVRASSPQEDELALLSLVRPFTVRSRFDSGNFA